MADSGSGISQVAEEVAQTTGEVIKDVKDTVGEMIEQNVQTTVGSQLTPQQIQQKQQEEQEQLTRVRKVIDYYKNLGGSIKKAQDERKQKEIERLKTQNEEKKVTEIKKEEKKKQPVNPALAYAGKVEFKRGVGG